MADLAQTIFFGLALGCTFALVALGLLIIYKASGVINSPRGVPARRRIVSAGVFEYHFFVALVIALVLTAPRRCSSASCCGRSVAPFSILMITIGRISSCAR